MAADICEEYTIEPPKQKILIVTIHGIHWSVNGEWQNQFGVAAKEIEPDLKVLHFRYGLMLGIFSWWISFANSNFLPDWARNRYVKKFLNFLRDIQKSFPDYEISVIAHSFGGWIVEQAISSDPNIILRNVLFIHCPISSHIEQTAIWNWLELNRVKHVFCYCSHNDFVIGKVAIKPFGQNGYWGFLRQGHPEDRTTPALKPYPIELYNIVDNEGHSTIWVKLSMYIKQLVENCTR